MALPVLLLAAGRSSRMGGCDKLMEPVGGVPLILRQARAVVAAGLDLSVALPGPDHPRARALEGMPHRPLGLPGSAEGLGGTLRDGVAALPGTGRFMILAADLPGITSEDLARVAGTDPGAARVVIATDAAGALGHPVLFDGSLRAAFAALSGDDGARAIVRSQKGAILTVALPCDHATRDLDTPEDWARFRAETGL